MALDKNRLSHLDEQISQLKDGKNSADIIKQTQESLSDLFEHSTVTSRDINKISDIKKLLSKKEPHKMKTEIELLTSIENAINEVKNKKIPKRSLDENFGITMEHSLLASTGTQFNQMRVLSLAYTADNETIKGSLSLGGKSSKLLKKEETLAIHYTDKNNKVSTIGSLTYNPKETRITFDEEALTKLHIDSIKLATESQFSLSSGISIQNQKTHLIQTSKKKKGSQGSRTSKKKKSTYSRGNAEGTTSNPSQQHTSPTISTETVESQVNKNANAIKTLQAQLQSMQSANTNNINIGGIGGLHTLPGFSQLPATQQLTYTSETVNKTQKNLHKKIHKLQKNITSIESKIVEKITDQGADIDEIKKQLSQLNEIKKRLTEENKKTQEELESIRTKLEGLIEGMDDRDTNLANSISDKFQKKINEITKSFDEIIENQNKKLDQTIETLNNNHKTITQQIKEQFDEMKREFLLNNSKTENEEKDREIEELKQKIKELEDKIDNRNSAREPEEIDTVEDITNNRQEEIAKAITLDAHLMDKKNLVKDSVHQDILQKTQKKYAEAGFFKKFGMFMVNRPIQSLKEKRTMKGLIENNNFIESNDTLQKRVAGSISTFAEEAKLGLSEESVEIYSGQTDNRVNTIASDYILKKINKSTAIRRFNQAFKDNPNLEMGEMTGTDIIEQLDNQGGDHALRYHLRSLLDNHPTGPIDYNKAKDAIREFFRKYPHINEFNNYSIDRNNLAHIPNKLIDQIRDDIILLKSDNALEHIDVNVNLVGIEKKYGAELAGTEINETGIRDKLGRFFSNKTGGAIPYGMAAGWATRALIYGSLTASGVGLPLALAGVVGTSGIIQYLKTYHDTLIETQNVHEKAIHMGPEEIQTHIEKLEKELQKHPPRRYGKLFGWGKANRLLKQKSIYQSVGKNLIEYDDEDKQYILKKSSDIIQGLEAGDTDAIIDVLARIRAGKNLGTNFISSSNRENVEDDRKKIMIALRKAGRSLPGAPADNASGSEWNKFWTDLVTKSEHKYLYQIVYEDLTNAHLNLTKDIDDNRHSKGLGDARKSMTTSAAILAAGAVAGGIVNGSRGKEITEEYLQETKTIEGTHRQYDIGKHTGGKAIHGSGREGGLTGSEHITIEGEASVDALTTSLGSYPHLPTHQSSVVSSISSSGLHPTTQASLLKSISTSGGLGDIATEGLKQGADPGNITLAQHRRLRMIEEDILNPLVNAKQTGVVIDDIKFDPSEFAALSGSHDIEIQKSISGAAASLSDRATAFNVHISELHPGTETIGKRYTWRPGDPWYIFWPGFSNTYAKPERLEKKSRSLLDQNRMSKKQRKKFFSWREKERKK